MRISPATTCTPKTTYVALPSDAPGHRGKEVHGIASASPRTLFGLLQDVYFLEWIIGEPRPRWKFESEPLVRSKSKESLRAIYFSPRSRIPPP